MITTPEKPKQDLKPNYYFFNSLRHPPYILGLHTSPKILE